MQKNLRKSALKQGGTPSSQRRLDSNQRWSQEGREVIYPSKNKMYAIQLFIIEKGIQRGQHLKIQRQGFFHHAIYVGEEEVVHFVPSDTNTENFLNLLWDKKYAEIKRTHFNEFLSESKFDEIDIVRYDSAKYDLETIATRAEKVPGHRGYHLIAANCEHLATYLSSGEWKSEQVNMVKVGTGIGAVCCFILGKMVKKGSNAFNLAGTTLGAVSLSLELLEQLTDTRKQVDQTLSPLTVNPA